MSSTRMARRNRAPAPCLSSNNLPLLPNSPQSTCTTTSSQFLSPPVPNPLSGTPPPSHEAEDYMDAQAVRRARLSQVRRRTRRSESKNAGSGGKSSSQNLPLSSASSLSSRQGYLISNVPDRGNLDSLMTVSALGQRTRSFPHPQTSSERQEAAMPYHMQMGMKTSAAKHRDSKDSPASDYLRRLSTSGQVKDHNWARRLSEALITRRDSFEPNSPDFTGLARNPKTGSFRTSLPHTQHNEPNTALRSILASITPERITLRKASKAQDSCTFSDDQRTEARDENAPCTPIAPSTELLAFRSTNGEKPQPQNTRPRSSTLSFSGSGSGTPKALTPIQDHGQKAHSSAADTVLTVADTHIAPGTFSVLPLSRHGSIVSSSQSRRLSLVQFKSRDSVYEVIWQENEKTSGSGSSGSASVGMYETASGSASSTIDRGMTQPSPNVSSRSIEADQGSDRQKYTFDRIMFDWTWTSSNFGPGSVGSTSHDFNASPRRARSTRTEANGLGSGRGRNVRTGSMASRNHQTTSTGH